MRRILYCPNESMIKEAEDISKVNFMQIQVGDSQSTDDITFDRSSVCVVEVPEFNYLEYKKNIDRGLHQVFNYHNDFITIDKSISAVFMGRHIKPIMAEKHYAKFIFPCNEVGEFAADIVFNKHVLESIVFNVN